MVQEQGRLMKSGKGKHKEKYYYRSDTPLYQRAAPSWYAFYLSLSCPILKRVFLSQFLIF